MMLEHTEETELSARVHQQEIVARLGLDALAGMGLQALMDEACVMLREALKADYCKVMEYIPGRNALVMRAGTGWRDGVVGSAMIPDGLRSQSGYTLIAREPVIVEDTRTETRFQTAQL